MKRSLLATIAAVALALAVVVPVAARGSGPYVLPPYAAVSPMEACLTMMRTIAEQKGIVAPDAVVIPYCQLLLKGK